MSTWLSPIRQPSRVFHHEIPILLCHDGRRTAGGVPGRLFVQSRSGHQRGFRRSRNDRRDRQGAELPQFWQTFANPAHGESRIALKVKITDPNGTEHMWVSDLERKDGKMTGTINNDAVTVKSVKIGDRITVPDADISDWLYMHDGKMYGNGTLRPLFKKMPPEEVQKIKKMIAQP